MPNLPMNGSSLTQLRVKFLVSISPICRALVFLFLLSISADKAASQDGFTIRELHIKGNEAFSEDDLKDQLPIKIPSWFKRVFGGEDPMNYQLDVVKESTDLLRGFYQREGYLYVEVLDPEIAFDEEHAEVRIVYTVREHPPVRVAHVTFEVQSTAASARATLDSIDAAAKLSFKLRVGDRFRDENANEDRRTLVAGYVNGGFPYLNVRHELEINSVDTSVSVRWKIDPGPPVTFGRITHTGSDSIEDEVIERRLRFAQGEGFSGEKLRQSQKDLYDLGIFNSVTFKPQLSAAKSAVVPVDIVTQFANQYQTRIGVGYGKEDKFRGFITFLWLRAFGGARTIDVIAKHSSLEPENISISFTQPDLIFRRTKLILNPYLVHEEEPGYASRRYGGGVAFRHGVAASGDLGLALTYENIKQHSKSVTPSTPAESTDVSYDKLSLAIGANRDNSRPIFNPTVGSVILAGLSFNRLNEDNTESKFIKSSVELRAYKRGIDWLIVAGRLEIASIYAMSETGFLPTDQKFFCGGSSSVRGYPRSSIGPTDAAGTPLGGKSLLEGSIEGRIHVAGSFGVVVFTDFGNVWEPSLTYPLGELQYAVGTGARFDTPVGPVRFDIAYPLFAGPQQVEYYFTIGQAF